MWKRGGVGTGLTLAMLAVAVCEVAQLAGEAGAPLIKTYPLKTLAGATQTWALLRDARSLLYVGSSSPDIHRYGGAV